VIKSNYSAILYEADTNNEFSVDMPDYYSDLADVILLDIEGTTTPIDYVLRVLFPFAKVQVESFLKIHHRNYSGWNVGSTGFCMKT